MISYQHFKLQNGLNVYLHKDESTPMAAFNLIYDVGSRNENPNKTGFAHLFEHLMFGGSQNVPSFDEPLQKVGGENNAFTSPDVTNYYITLPAANIETAFWLESDRMLSLSFDPKVLEVQRKVVIEEFKQRYLNQPYGDIWLKYRPLAYQVHPYQWATIGKEISHIENATMDDVKDFFFTFYRPNNAHLVIAGNFELDYIKGLCEKWFGPIPSGPQVVKNIPQEPKQTEKRFLETEADVPLSSIYKGYKMPGRYKQGYYETDFISDVLGRGKSSRLYQKLVTEEKLFNSISAYVMGSFDEGLLMISGNVNKSVDVKTADAGIAEVIDSFKNNPVTEAELIKVKNKAEATRKFENIEILNKALRIAYAASAGDINYLNEEEEQIEKVSSQSIKTVANDILVPENSSTMFYLSKN